MNVSAVIVTRGDHDLSPILDSLLRVVDEILIWDNSGEVTVEIDDEPRIRWLNHGGDDLAVYGRYAAIAEAKNPLIFCQDDDCVLPPESIQALIEGDYGIAAHGVLVANMPAAFREQDFYREHALVGFGAVFHRDLPRKAFIRYLRGDEELWDAFQRPGSERSLLFERTCDVVFTALTPRVLVDVPYENLPWASEPGRMWTSPGHQEERQRMLDLVRKVRDAETVGA